MVSEVKLPLHLGQPSVARSIQRWHHAATRRRFFVQRAASHERLAMSQIISCRRADDGRHRDETRRHPASEIDARRVYGHWQ